MVMTGYKPPAKTYTLTFGSRPGLEVVMSSVSVGELVDMAGLADDISHDKATVDQINRMFVMFADRLVSWNVLSQDDQPVPADLTGVRSQGMDLVVEIFTGWFDGMTQGPKATGPEDLTGLPAETLPG